MNDVEFLRQLSDMINAKLQMLDSNPAPRQVGEIPPVGTGDEGCHGDNCEGNEADNPMDRDDTFVPPLQAKLEIMKKLAGIPAKDETLKQSQEQGGPTNGDAISIHGAKVVSLDSMFGGDETFEG